MGDVRKPRVIVLGAGPAGLAFASRYGDGAVVLERSAAVGGLSRSIDILDGTFDIGGHSFHTPHAEVQDLVQDLMAGRWHQQPRDARVWFRGEIIPYPFQQHYTRLSDKTVVADCHHTPEPAQIAASRNFEEWILNRFGRGLAEHFMLPYNRKIWARDLRDMSCDWVGQRIAAGRAGQESAAGKAPGRKPLEAGSWVAYPAEGGFGAIFDALARRCPRIAFREDILRIDIDHRVAISRSGRSWHWDRLVSTMPLPALLNAVTACPERLRRLSERLQAVSLKIVMLLIRKPEGDVPQRVYVAEPDVPAHKIAFNHASSPRLAERPHHAVTCEVSYSAEKPWLPDHDLVAAMSGWLMRAGFIAARDDVVTAQVIDVPLGYPVSTHEKSGIVAEIRDYLSRHEIHSIGRFGAWDYANSDECMRQGIELARRFLAKRDWDPRAST